MRRLKPFFRDEKGTATIEFVLWIPVIMALVAIVIDATTLYVMHAEIWNVARDTARQMSSGLITCEEDAEQHAADSIRLHDAPYAVRAVYNEDSGSSVVIAFSFNDIAITGVGSWLYQKLTMSGGMISARVVMRHDPRITFDCGTGGGGGGGGGGGRGGGNADV